MKVKVREDVKGDRSAIIAFITFIIALVLMTPMFIINEFPTKEIATPDECVFESTYKICICQDVFYNTKIETIQTPLNYWLLAVEMLWGFVIALGIGVCCGLISDWYGVRYWKEVDYKKLRG